jgi:hypothetical protein
MTDWCSFVTPRIPLALCSRSRQQHGAPSWQAFGWFVVPPKGRRLNSL